MGKDINVCVEEEMGVGQGMKAESRHVIPHSVPPRCVSPAAPGETRAGLPMAGAAAGAEKGHASR